MISSDDAAGEQVDVAGVQIDAEALARLPRTLALRYDILSLYTEGNEIAVALLDAQDRDAIERVRLATGMHVRAFSAPRDAIHARLVREFEQVHVPRVSVTHSSLNAPAVTLLAQVQDLAIASGASDVHFEPLAGGCRIRQRVDGVLRQTRTLPSPIFTQVISRVKLLAGMDIADRRQPQDGEYTVDHHGRATEIRVSSVPTVYGEKLVLRLQNARANGSSLETLGFIGQQLERIRESIQCPHGLVVICGPTSSGKTTTLYAALTECNTESANICTVEDPVEIRLSGVTQVQVNPRAGVTFASAVRAFLRQDPNVIMIGELRDCETATVAGAAVLSGHLIFTTVHANDCIAAIDRLAELGMSRHALASGLGAIVAQRLVRRLCLQCSTPLLTDDALAREFGVRPGIMARSPRGCAQCGETGYRGRTAIFEILPLTEHVRSHVAQAAVPAAMRQAAVQCGYQPLLFQGVHKVLNGETTFDELRRVLAVARAAA